MDPYQELLAVIAVLDKARLPYALCGGLALTLFGRVRATEDIDLMVRAGDVAAVKEAVRKIGFRIEAFPMVFDPGTPEERRLHRVTKFKGAEYIVLDLIEAEPGFLSVWEGRRRYDTNDGPITAVSFEGLIAMKRRAGRFQDLADLRRLEGPEDGAPLGG